MRIGKVMATLVVCTALARGGIAEAAFSFKSYVRNNFKTEGDVVRCSFVEIPELRISDYPTGKTSYGLYDAKAKEQADSLFRFDTWSDASPIVWQGFGGYGRLLLKVPAAKGITARIKIDIDGRDITSLFKMDTPSGDWLYPSAGPRGNAPILDAVAAGLVLRARVYGSAGQLIATRTFDVSDFRKVAPALTAVKWACIDAPPPPPLSAPRPPAPPAPPAPASPPAPPAPVRQLPG
jgi:hypothetical protein